MFERKPGLEEAFTPLASGHFRFSPGPLSYSKSCARCPAAGMLGSAGKAAFRPPGSHGEGAEGTGCVRPMRSSSASAPAPNRRTRLPVDFVASCARFGSDSSVFWRTCPKVHVGAAGWTGSTRRTEELNHDHEIWEPVRGPRRPG